MPYYAAYDHYEVTLKDRIAPPSSPLPQAPVLVNARDLLSRISIAITRSKEGFDSSIQSSSPDAPASGQGASCMSLDLFHSMQSSNPSAASSVETVPVSAGPPPVPPSLLPSTTSFSAAKPAAPSVPLPTPVTQPLTHPLPPKPVLALGANGSSRGSKRGRPISPDSPVRRPRRAFRWPTVDSNYSVGLKGEGQLGIRAISFNSDGSFFALSCEWPSGIDFARGDSLWIIDIVSKVLTGHYVFGTIETGRRLQGCHILFILLQYPGWTMILVSFPWERMDW